MIGFYTHVVASCKLPADDGLRDDQDRSRRTPSRCATVAQRHRLALTPDDMAADIGVPFHPGAAKFYKEAGITV